MDVIMISPGYPGEMPSFTRGLASMGARVIGLGDQASGSLPASVKEVLAAHIHVGDLWDEWAVAERVRHETQSVHIDRVECLWEPALHVAARIRETLGIPGLGVEQTAAFRDKERMKQVLDSAGVRTPWHTRATSSDECRAASERVGFPLIIKPIAGAGSTDTYRIRRSRRARGGSPAARPRCRGQRRGVHRG